MKIKLDFDAMETADDGNTTHYGGIIKVSNATRTVEVQATGSDREFSPQIQIDIIAAIQGLLQRQLTEAEEEMLGNHDDFQHYTNCELEFS